MSNDSLGWWFRIELTESIVIAAEQEKDRPGWSGGVR